MEHDLQYMRENGVVKDEVVRKELESLRSLRLIYEREIAELRH